MEDSWRPAAFPCFSGSLMGSLVRAVLVMVLLDPALLTQEHQDLSTMEPLPRLNMKFDPWKMKLTWDCKENTTAIQCGISDEENGPVTKKVKENECHCIFQNSIIHKGSKLLVKVNINQSQIREELIFTNAGENDTAAQNVSCSIYNADFMNCTWAKGRAAPGDVQYFFHIQDFKRGREIECPHYVEDAGIHVGCHLEGASGFSSNIYILVNGTSRTKGIQFFDDVLLLHRIEVYNPPSNITIHCNKSHCLIQWQKPRSRLNLSNREFQYQLDIHRQNSMEHSDHQLVEVSGDLENKYNFPSPQPAARHTVQIRTTNSRLLHWGAWSPPAEFGSEERAPSLAHVYVLVVLGTLVGVQMLCCLLKRLVGRPVPQIKDKWTGGHLTDDEIIWEKCTPAEGKGDHEEVLTVEAVGESMSRV
ncbi:granulocyte-macrophage colony-stimulating factor receptor subunit alpha isoform X1 [Molossus molossus]|uniref:Fibronectin type-III domain-containing protein n=2 Tax=Molossus molossus TaxID=27622 RepID=A0A7J8J5Y1_MOLMO|nr:granulocyte-macrophage colony-stimulating factor receptor subunit alpha isoform X1 [Molossus molossus]KAF6491921.1 hypothetical protein HJG59_003400 [Molossus molossus]